MRNISAIMRRELAFYFDSPMAYILVPVFLGLVASFTLWFQDVFAQGTVQLRTVSTWSAVFFILFVPAVTMRLFAEERRTGTMELLATLPATETEMVLGKYLAALGLIAVALLLTLGYPLTFAILAEVDPGPVLGGYVGLFLLGASYCAIGTAASAGTANQVVAFLLSLFLCLVPFAMGFFLHQVPAPLLPLVQYLSFDYHFNNLARGVLDTRDLVFYLSVVALGLHVAVHSLVLRRLG